MREIKFRGRCIASGQMLIGGGIDLQRDTPLIISQGHRFHVLDKTIGQFTGLQDINGADIYEGDILHQLDPVSWEPVVVLFDNLRACYCVNKEQLQTSTIKQVELIIVGNVHQSPELLEK